MPALLARTNGHGETDSSRGLGGGLEALPERMDLSVNRRMVALLLMLGVAACGGAGGSSSLPPLQTAPPATTPTGTATPVPGASSSPATGALPSATPTPTTRPSATPTPTTRPSATPTPSASPSATPAPSTLNYVALGDSTAVGVGTSATCPPDNAPQLPNPPDCPNGQSYAAVVAESLAGSPNQPQTNPRFTDLGITGATVSDYFEQLANRNTPPQPYAIPSNVTDNELLSPALATANVVTLYVGLNDVNVIYTAVKSGADVGMLIDQFGSDYASLVDAVGKKSPGVKIILVNLPNFAGLAFGDYGYGPRNPDLSLYQQISVGLDQQAINPLARSVYAVIDLLCDPQTYSPSNYSDDGFHPNEAGYAHIAQLIYSAIVSGPPTPPASSCSTYTQQAGLRRIPG